MAAHGPIAPDEYFNIHDTVMARLRTAGHIDGDNLTLRDYPGTLFLSGEIACRGGILITVRKHLTVLEDGRVQTRKYAYNAGVQGHETFLRHDNAHPHPGHPDEHHAHRLDWRTGEDLEGSPEHVGVDGWPTLGAFIENVMEWYYDHAAELPSHEYARLGIRSGAACTAEDVED